MACAVMGENTLHQPRGRRNFFSPLPCPRRDTIGSVKRAALLLAFFAAASALPGLSLRYYFSPECGTCRDFLGREVPRVEKAVARKLPLELRDVRRASVIEELQAVLAERGLALTAVPVLVMDDVVLVGTRQVAARFEAEVRRLLAGEAASPTPLDNSTVP